MMYSGIFRKFFPSPKMISPSLLQNIIKRIKTVGTASTNGSIIKNMKIFIVIKRESSDID